MKCPNCQQTTSDKALLQCSHCGEAFERGPLEEFQHLAYLAEWLIEQREISPLQKKILLKSVEAKQLDLRTQLLPKTDEAVKPAEQPIASSPQPAVALPPVVTPPPI